MCFGFLCFVFFLVLVSISDGFMCYACLFLFIIFIYGVMHVFLATWHPLGKDYSYFIFNHEHWTFSVMSRKVC